MHKIGFIEIVGLRACHHVAMPLESFTPLVGQNNAGKSTILFALAWVLKPSALEPSDFSKAGERIVVTARIDGINEEILKLIPEAKHRAAIAPFCDTGSMWIRVVGTAPGAKGFNCKVFDVDKYSGDGIPEAWRNYPTGLPQAVSALLPEALRIDAMDDLGEDLGKAKAGSTLKSLLDLIMGPIVEAHAELVTAMATVQNILGTEGKSRLGHLKKFDQGATKALADFFPGLAIELGLQTIEVKEFFKAGSLNVTDLETGDCRTFDQLGTGSQRAIQMALIRHLADLKIGTTPLAARRMLLIDEPELYLHPQGIRRLRQALAALSQMGFQVVYATHSPLMLSREARDKFLGPGTFGTGSKAEAALAEARRIGTEELPAITAARAPGARSQPQTIVKAIRDLGGINTGAVSSRGMAGELADLRQAGLGNIMQKGRGQSLDTLAQAAHAQGYIAEPDPALLLNALRDHAAGQRVVSSAADQTGLMQVAREAAMGDAPGALTLPKPVAFREIQNMRSSLGEAAAQASAKGANKEAAALRQMIADLDNQTAQVAAGRGGQGEYFPADIVKAWQDAVQMHADKMTKYHTGPQASMFRQGGDGLSQAQGGELAAKFFSPRMSQASDIASFNRIATPETQAALKNYAITDAANQTDRLGNLTNAKFNNWLKARSGAVDGLMTEGERAQLRGVASDLMRADQAATLNMAKGSPTVQNALSLGALDNKFVKALMNRTPIVGRFTGPMLEALQNTARAGKVAQIGGLLSDPAAFDTALAQYLSQSSRAPIGILDPGWLGLARAVPVLPANSGRP